MVMAKQVWVILFYKIMFEQLSNYDREQTINRYNKRFKEFGYDQKSLGWGIKGRQKERFKILIDILKINLLKDLKVCDIGAGFGDLYKYMLDNKISLKEYFGYEIVPNLVKEGNKQYKKYSNFNLFNDDYLEKKENKNVDISIISGSFNFKIKKGENYQYIENVLKKAFNNSSHGVSANFITNRTDYKDDLIFYANPEKIIDICYGLTKRFVLDHSYFPFEFSIAIFKDDKYDKSMPVFDDNRLKI